MKATSKYLRVIARHLAALERELPEARVGQMAAVHRARVASRRLRAALAATLGSDRGVRRARKHVKRLSALLGPVRETDVALAMLDTEAAAADVPRASTGRVRQALALERRIRLRALRDGVGPEAASKLRRRVRSVVRESRTAARSVQRRVAAARQDAAGKAVALETQIHKAGRRFAPSRLHEVRIAAKKLRYALEIVEAFERSSGQCGLETLREAQARLGHLHDIVVLKQRVRDAQASGTVALRHTDALERLVRHLDGQARGAHAHYLDLVDDIRAICRRTRKRARRASALDR